MIIFYKNLKTNIIKYAILSYLITPSQLINNWTFLNIGKNVFIDEDPNRNWIYSSILLQLTIFFSNLVHYNGIKFSRRIFQVHLWRLWDVILKYLDLLKTSWRRHSIVKEVILALLSEIYSIWGTKW